MLQPRGHFTPPTSQEENTAAHLSERSPLLSLLPPDWLPVPPDLLLLPTEAWLLAAMPREELCEEPLLLSISSQPPPTWPGHLWVPTRVKRKRKEAENYFSLDYRNLPVVWQSLLL